MTSSTKNWRDTVMGHLEHAPKPLIVVLGPTAGGKTDFSLQLAEFLRGEGREAEIINADSRQLYRLMDIGTAKISDEEMRGIPHHLLSVLDPKEEVTVFSYKARATKVIDDCHTRGVIPILVGGSMLYISAIVDGLEPLPPPNPETRARLQKEWDEDDGITLYDKLVRVDPETAKNFSNQNKRYVVRALELYEMFGVAPSTIKKTVPPPYQILQFGMEWSREELVKRIEERTRKMLSAGWIQEVEGLLDRGYTPVDPGMMSHGYREIIQWLQTEDQDLELLAEVIARKTKAYAKRQLTWWNKDDRIMWIKT